MADVEFDQFDEGGSWLNPDNVQRVVNWAGALTSLALVIGVGIWGYQLAVRDVTGVPVIRALKGPLRIAPEDPGGQIAAHQGLAVNAIAGDEPQPDLPNKVILAPAPVQLTSEDRAAEDGKPATPEAPPAVSTEAAPNDPVAAAIASATRATQPGVAPAPPGAVTRSPIPLRRPDDLLPVPAAPAAPQVTEIDGASLPAGTRLVQLGAFDSVDVARAEWDKMARRFSGLLGGKNRVIQKAESAGRTFYRLRAAGFSDEADARRFCAALLADDAACVPVILR
ncbi:SPOR domain-containing protein [Acidimangrovimonas pyrenivorans]|uniref:SPOR domain-containing protein n=1 Tax=Acidimangrovimonas pyrenivorans TaxID=2030798 RepID=A0ABV7ADT0_9RHOB